MSIADKIFLSFVEKKLGADFEEKVMECLENQSCSQEELINEIIEHYQAIIQLLLPNYQSVKLDKNDLLKIYINDIEFDLDDRSSAKGRKAAEHRMAIEFLLPDVGEDDYSNIIMQAEKRLNHSATGSSY